MSRQQHIILGIDPGLNKTGWGVVAADGNHLSYLAHGLIKTNPKDDLSKRLKVIYCGVCEVLKSFCPTDAAIEDTFMNSNPASSLKLGAARAAAMLAPANAGLGVSEYGASKIKKSIVGVGHADKNQVAMMVKLLLPTCPQSVHDDAADALAVAICHAHWGYKN